MDRELLICLLDLGVDRLWLFHLRQEAIIMAAHGRGFIHDGCFLLCRLSLAYVPDLSGADRGSLLSAETRLLIFAGAMALLIP